MKLILNENLNESIDVISFKTNSEANVYLAKNRNRTQVCINGMYYQLHIYLKEN